MMVAGHLVLKNNLKKDWLPRWKENYDSQVLAKNEQRKMVTWPYPVPSRDSTVTNHEQVHIQRQARQSFETSTRKRG